MFTYLFHLVLSYAAKAYTFYSPEFILVPFVSGQLHWAILSPANPYKIYHKQRGCRGQTVHVRPRSRGLKKKKKNNVGGGLPRLCASPGTPCEKVIGTSLETLVRFVIYCTLIIIVVVVRTDGRNGAAIREVERNTVVTVFGG